MATNDLGLSEEQYAALRRHPDQVRLLADQLLAADGSIVTRTLRRGPGAIARLKTAGNYTGYCDPGITDKAFPSEGEGEAPVRYRTLNGNDLKRPDGFVSRIDVEAALRKQGMRFPDADEALLPPAEDDTIGRGGKPYIAFIRGARDAFGVGEGGDGQRNLYHSSGNDDYDSSCVFIGVVCE